MSATPSIVRLARPFTTSLDFLSPLLNLGIRLWIANVFWKSGLTKIGSWETTVMLFTHEYQVPLLSPEVAAAAAIVVELLFPVLLAIGLAGRLSALALFVFNAVAVISYPELSEAGLKEHYYWGVLLLVPLLYGPGRLSLDHFIANRWHTNM